MSRVARDKKLKSSCLNCNLLMVVWRAPVVTLCHHRSPLPRSVDDDRLDGLTIPTVDRDPSSEARQIECDALDVDPAVVRHFVAENTLLGALPPIGIWCFLVSNQQRFRLAAFPRQLPVEVVVHVLMATARGSLPGQSWRIHPDILSSCPCGRFMVVETADSNRDLLVCDTKRSSMTELRPQGGCFWISPDCRDPPTG